MTIRTRLALTVVGVALVAVLPAAYAVARLRELHDIAEELRTRHGESQEALGQAETSLARADQLLRAYVADPQPDVRERAEDELERVGERLRELARRGFVRAQEVEERQLDPVEAEVGRLEALVEAGQLQEATDVQLPRVIERIEPLQRSLDEMEVAIETSATESVERAGQVSRAAEETALMALLVAFLAAISVGTWSIHGLIRPVLRLRSAMATVASGTLVAPDDLPYGREDEIGDLSQSFRSMTRHLAELDRLKAEFISMTSHDLKTPINVIGGYAELMEEGIFGELTEKQREVLSAMREQTESLTRQVTQLLDISRIEAGGLRIEPAEVELDELFAAVSRTFEALARQKEIDFAVEIEPSAPESAALDPERIRNEVLGNLLSNAFKFTPTGGSVGVRVGADAEGLRIEVSDTGVGIPPDRLPHVFDKYYQVGPEARGAGAGLGLAIVREIIEAHGGRIEAESEPGVGSTFRITLPLRHLEGAPPRPVHGTGQA